MVYYCNLSKLRCCRTSEIRFELPKFKTKFAGNFGSSLANFATSEPTSVCAREKLYEIDCKFFYKYKEKQTPKINILWINLIFKKNQDNRNNSEQKQTKTTETIFLQYQVNSKDVYFWSLFFFLYFPCRLVKDFVSLSIWLLDVKNVVKRTP